MHKLESKTKAICQPGNKSIRAEHTKNIEKKETKNKKAKLNRGR